MSRRKAKQPQTTRQRLQGIIKESRNIMRKDAGLNGELDRLPQLAWLLFLRAFDDFEQEREVTDRNYTPALTGAYRWSEWARGDQTGEPLLEFVNDDLLPHLRGLQGSGKAGDPRDTIAQIFSDVSNRMLSGYLLKDLITQLDQIEFTNTDDIHTMAHLYESMLKEMRDAAGDSGEFYTPRPLVRFMVDMVDPQVGEVVMDPAMGTGGFLVEAYEHMMEQATTSAQRTKVQQSIRGIEKKPMPLLLAQMNLLLHHIDRPRVVRQNALAEPVRDLRSDYVDVVVTNPPFGGEEEVSIRSNFPSTMRTSETVWLFLQAVMARLEKSKNRHARCAIVVPNSVLFDTGVGARIKAHLMEHFNLHTVLRLPNGVFAPYTVIPSNVLFFEKGKQSDHVWFYEHPLPEGRKNYTKTKPLTFEEFAPCVEWWGGSDREGRIENEQAWRVPTKEIVEADYSLDLRNPRDPDDLAHRPPALLLDELAGFQRALKVRLDARASRTNEFALLADTCRTANSRPLGAFLAPKSGSPVSDSATYDIAGVYSFGRGLLRRPSIRGAETKYSSLTQIEEGDVVYSKLGAFEGAVAVVSADFDGSWVSPEFPTFVLDDGIEPEYVRYVITSPWFREKLARVTAGVGARQKRVSPSVFLAQEIPVPSTAAQLRVVRALAFLEEIQRDSSGALAIQAALLAAGTNEILGATR